MTKGAEKMLQWRREHKALGLCIWCVAKAMPGRAFCERHRKEASIRSKSYSKSQVAKGLCADCHRKLSKKSKRWCDRCRIMQQQAQKKYKNKHLQDGK